MVWGDETGDDADVAAVKPDVIIFLKVPPIDVRTRLRKDSVSSSRSEKERIFLTSTHASFLECHDEACERFMELTDILYHVVPLTKITTPREVAQRVYKILKEGFCADKRSVVPVKCLMTCSHRVKKLTETCRVPPLHLVRGFQ